jgi:hypothetical protein
MISTRLVQFASLLGLIVTLLAASGCSGVNSGVGVSPASFLLPGLILNEPTPVSPATSAETNSVVVAQCP